MRLIYTESANKKRKKKRNKEDKDNKDKEYQETYYSTIFPNDYAEKMVSEYELSTTKESDSE